MAEPTVQQLLRLTCVQEVQLLKSYLSDSDNQIRLLGISDFYNVILLN